MKVVAYARYSSDNQREESIDAQIRAIKKYCKENKYILLNIYIDEARTGTNQNRPQFQQMLKSAKNKEFEAVVVHKFDRFSRNKMDAVRIKYELKQQGVKVLSILEPLNGTPEDVIIESLYEGMAEYYSLNLAREVRKGMIENAEKGLTTGGTAPLGLDIVDKKYVINEYEAGAVRLIFDMYASGNTYLTIINTLNKKGYVTKKGKDFGKNSLYEILRNEKYIGNYIYNTNLNKRKGKTNHHAKVKEEDIIRKNGIIPAIIDNDTWNIVQKKMEEKKKMGRRSTGKSIEPYILSGILICGACGSVMHGNRRNNGKGKENIYSSYVCSNRNCKAKSIKKETIEKAVISQLKGYFTEDTKKELHKMLEEKLIESQKNYVDKTNIYKKELRETEQKIDNIVEAIANGLYNPKMKKKMEQLENKKSELNSLIENNYIYTAPTYEQFKEYLEMVLNFANKDDLNAYKNIIDYFVENVILTEDDIIVNVKIQNIGVGTNGAPKRTRTSDSQFRKLQLYPTELWMHIIDINIIKIYPLQYHKIKIITINFKKY